MNACNMRNFILCWVLAIFAIYSQQAMACIDNACLLLDNYRQHEIHAWWMQNSEPVAYEEHLRLRSMVLHKNHPANMNNLLPLLEEIVKGEGTVLVFERKFKGWNKISDTSHLTKLIIFTKKTLSEKGEIKISKNTTETIAFLVDGSPSFNEFCFGYAREGEIKYRIYDKNKNSDKPFFKTLNINNGISAVISLKFALINNDDSSAFECASCAFDADLIFSKRSPDEAQRNPG